MKFTDQLIRKTLSQRLVWIRKFFLGIALIILLRSCYLQVIDRPHLDSLEKQQKYTNKNKIQRGSIYDSNQNIIAASIAMSSVFIIPREIEKPNQTAHQLSKTLNLPYSKVLKKITSKSSFVWLKKYILPTTREKLTTQKISGIHTTKEFKRFYPRQQFASQLIGFSGVDSKGLEGLEYKYNNHFMGVVKKKGKLKRIFNNSLSKLPQGGSMELTIHDLIQYVTEKELKKATSTMKAKSGVAIVMDSQTGAILSMASTPSFNPNFFGKYEQKNYFNRAIGDAYEPGSTFKIITIASALEKGLVTKEHIFNCENGAYQIQDRIIHDTHKYGWLNLQKIIQKSSNICAAKIGQLIPKPTFYKMIQEFGFGKKTYLNLPGEGTGKVFKYQRWTDIDIATISFGHTISATPIQLISAMNVIATGGVYLSPYLIKNEHLIQSDKPKKPRVKKRILKEKTAKEITQYMITVTQKGGTGYQARLKGISVAGKTGTAEKFDRKKGEYSSTNNVVSFVGFFPAEAPKLTILVIINEPQEKYLGSKGVAPVFRKIAKATYKIVQNQSLPKKIFEQERLPIRSIFATRKTSPKNRKQKNTDINFKKLTLREVLAKSSEKHLSIQIKGSGTVRSQKKITSGPGGLLRVEFQ
ncbi:MAG: cell division protein FtsI (penicillin-binding protein 3) [bacterium]